MRRVNTDQRNLRRNQPVRSSCERLLHAETGAADFMHTDFNINLVVESGRRQVINFHPPHHEHDSCLVSKFILLEPESAQPFRARAFHEF